MKWIKQTPDSEIAKRIGEGIRTIQVAEDAHAVITRIGQRAKWEYWRLEHGVWTNVGGFPSATKAKDAAFPMPEAPQPVPAMVAGESVVLTATWTKPYHGTNPITVTCSSDKIAEEITGMFYRLGLDVQSKVVEAA